MDKSLWSKELWDIYHEGMRVIDIDKDPNPYPEGTMRWNAFEDGRETKQGLTTLSPWQDDNGFDWKEEHNSQYWRNY